MIDLPRIMVELDKEVEDPFDNYVRFHEKEYETYGKYRWINRADQGEYG